MRFKEFLLEENLSFDHAIKKIGEECGPFFEAARSNYMFRGIPNRALRGEKLTVDNPEARYTETPKDRPPKDSDPVFNFWFNAAAYKRWGIENVRRKCFFCTGDEMFANFYGEVNFVFPVGAFNFAWHSDIHDSFEDGRGDLLDALSKNSEFPSHRFTSITDILRKHISPRDFIDDKPYTLQAMKTEFADTRLEKDYDDILAGILEFIDGYKVDTQLDYALKRGNEILVWGCPGYYTIPRLAVLEKMKADGFQAEEYSYGRMYDYILKLIGRDKN